MPRWLKYILDHPQLIIAIVVIGGPILARIMKAIAAAATRRQQNLEQERREYETLRTGGVSPPVRTPALQRPPEPAAETREESARAELERMAAQRREQIETSRRRADVQGPPPIPETPDVSTSGGNGGVTVVHLPGGVVLELPNQPHVEPPVLTPRTQAQERPMPPAARAAPTMVGSTAPSRDSKSERARRRAEARAQRDRQMAREMQEQQAAAERQWKEAEALREARHRGAQQKEREASMHKPMPSSRRLLMGPKGAFTRLDMKRAIMMQEILGPPKSARGD